MFKKIFKVYKDDDGDTKRDGLKLMQGWESPSYTEERAIIKAWKNPENYEQEVYSYREDGWTIIGDIHWGIFWQDLNDWNLDKILPTREACISDILAESQRRNFDYETWEFMAWRIFPIIVEHEHPIDAYGEYCDYKYDTMRDK